ncbi:MAG: amino acid ABC transporter substrate-binding protein [Gammaproteobacteria bacterium]|nr:amino acid ABC transporter substrate-binding protein [Gammaproteobacteria bacterium]
MRSTMAGIVLAFWAALLPQSLLARAPVLDTVRESGRIVFGYSEDAPPFSFVDRAGKPAGYSLDLCRAVAEQVRRELKLPRLDIAFVAVESADRINALANGRVDMDCSTTTQTLGRMERVDFTLMTFVTGASMLSLRDTDFREPSQIQGKKVAVIAGTTTEDVLTQYLIDTKLSAEIVSVSSLTAGMGMLVEGSIDGFFSDRALLIGQIMQSPERDRLQISEDMISFEPYALMVPRDDADFRLVANRALAQIYNGQQIGILYRKWFGLVGSRPSSLLISVFRLQALPE